MTAYGKTPGALSRHEILVASQGMMVIRGRPEQASVNHDLFYTQVLDGFYHEDSEF